MTALARAGAVFGPWVGEPFLLQPRPHGGDRASGRAPRPWAHTAWRPRALPGAPVRLPGRLRALTG
jgi:hypothetical protein